MGTVVLVRHGETEWNREHRIQGWAPSSLNERGRSQAERAGDALGESYDVDRLVASDLERTRETTRILRPRLGVDRDRVSFDGRWRERNFGVLQGLDYQDLFGGGFPEFNVEESGAAALQATPEGGESIADLCSRVLDAWEDLVEDLSDETAVVVTHGGPIHVVSARVRGHDLITELEANSMGNCTALEIGVGDGEPSVVCVTEPPER